MKFYLIDDDQNIINILKLIIQNRNLGEICGTSLNAEDAMDDLKYVQPDIVIVDLLMPVMDGITFGEAGFKALSGTCIHYAVPGCRKGYDFFCV